MTLMFSLLIEISDVQNCCRGFCKQAYIKLIAAKVYLYQQQAYLDLIATYLEHHLFMGAKIANRAQTKSDPIR
jgi:hypothetical protein